jgi:hypothetical protein
MMRLLVALFAVASVSGCATATMVPYQVESTPPGARIEVNSVSMGATPTTIELQCSKRWVGVAVTPGGWAFDNAVYDVSAFPTKDHPGLSQTKRVNACQLKEPPGRLHFDLGLDTVSPRQRIDVNVNQSDKATSLDDTIRALRHLRDQGLLSEQDYQQKVDKVIKDAAR